MDDIAPDSGEAVLRKTQNLIIHGVRHEAVFTDRRLILTVSGTNTIHEEIPYTGIRHALSGMNRLREPVISLTLPARETETRTLEIIFIHTGGNENVAERDKCIAVLKDHDVPVEVSAPAAGPEFTGSGQRVLPGERVAEDLQGRPAVPDWTVFGTSRRERRAPEDEGPKRSPAMVAVAVLFVIVILVIGMTVAGQWFTPKNAAGNQSTTGPKVTTKAVPSPTPAHKPSPAPAETAAAAPDAGPAGPTNGVWVLVSYPGNYTGSIGAQGRYTGVNGTGNQSYKIPADNVMIEGSVEKLDGSTDLLEVGIYNGGSPVWKSATAKPWGLIDIHVPVGPAVGNPVVKSTPFTEKAVYPNSSLPRASIPSTGVYVRIYHAGNYTGTVSANGVIREVNSTGDLVFQLPIANGKIDSIIEKTEGTANPLFIEVYRDGKLVDQGYTPTPLGVLDLHTVL